MIILIHLYLSTIITYSIIYRINNNKNLIIKYKLQYTYLLSDVYVYLLRLISKDIAYCDSGFLTWI